MDDICLQALSVRYEQRFIFQNLNHRFAAGQWHIIIGRSGMGKTTLLHAIADLLDSAAHVSGTISAHNGKALTGNIAYMAQQNDLLPWLSVRDNVLLSARLHHQTPDIARANELLSACGLLDYANRRITQLSGGQKQRVALARTLMQERPYILMDEPFSALDAITRYELQALAAQLLTGKTIIMITHDPSEALRLADTLHILTPQGLQSIPLPNTPPPRALDTQGLASLQEHLINTLRHD